jgi:hypothetical protein
VSRHLSLRFTKIEILSVYKVIKNQNNLAPAYCVGGQSKIAVSVTGVSAYRSPVICPRKLLFQK